MHHLSLRVLLIEDDPDDVRLVREALAEIAHAAIRLEHAAGLARGLAQLREGGLDAVLLDLGLPEASGLETLRQVLQCDPCVPVVVLTGFDVDDFALEALKAGAQDYLAKNRLEGRLILRTLRYAIERSAGRAGFGRADREHPGLRGLVGSGRAD